MDIAWDGTTGKELMKYTTLITNLASDWFLLFLIYIYTGILGILPNHLHILETQQTRKNFGE